MIISFSLPVSVMLSQPLRAAVTPPALPLADEGADDEGALTSM